MWEEEREEKRGREEGEGVSDPSFPSVFSEMEGRGCDGDLVVSLETRETGGKERDIDPVPSSRFPNS
jgi:hypothetical protein